MMQISREESALKLHFPTGVELKVDLDALNLTDEQNRVLTKLVSLSGELEAECRDDDTSCPAQANLEPAEFEAVRGLSVGLRSADVEPAGTLVDFCLHVSRVHRIK